MNLLLQIQNSIDGTTYDISDIAQQIQVSQSLDGEAGKLTTILQKDPNNIIDNMQKIANGSFVHFAVDGQTFFCGYVFKIGTDADGNYKITCYDLIRYLKNSEIYTFKNMTASDIFEKICKDYELKYEIKVPTKYIPEPYQYEAKSLYTIIKRGMDLASINDQKQYFIVDRNGVLTWSELEAEVTNIQLGDGSVVTSFTYEKSIDDDTYNSIKLYRNNETSGKVDTWIVKDSDSIKQWGTLQLMKKADDEANSAQIRETATNYLKIKNRETETLKIQAEGILELTAGKGIRVTIPRENIDKWMWIKSCTHSFTKYEHTMDLEVSI